MKTFIIFIFILTALNLTAQIKVTNTGNVGIGNNSPSYKLDVNGIARISPNGSPSIIFDEDATWGCASIYASTNNNLWLGRSNSWANHLWCYNIDYQNLTKVSDINLKENIKSYSDVIPKIKQIKTYKYNYKDSYFKDFTIGQKQKAQRKEFGFIAQELEKVFPELVFKSDSGLLSIDYVSMIPILTAAINEQQQIIVAQSKKIKELDNRLTSLEDTLANNESQKSTTKSATTNSSEYTNSNTEENNQASTSIDLLTNTFLYQNSPNPFSETTEINYFISEGIESSILMIFDMQGTLIRQVSIKNVGFGKSTIKASELKPGMYIYTLICDGQEIDTKRMILSK